MLLFLTLTASHTRDESLEAVLDDAMGSWTDLRKSRQWRGLMEHLGCEHWIRVTEITHSEANGWHPHHHVALFVTKRIGLDIENYPEEITLLREFIDGEWHKAMWHKRGRVTSTAHSVDLQAVTDADGIGGYLSKIELEMARSDLKRAKNGSRSPFQLALDSADGDFAATKLWVEYVITTKGRRWISTSHKLWEQFGIRVKDDLEIVEEDAIKEPETICEISASVYTTAVWRESENPIMVEVRHLAESDLATPELLATVRSRRLGRQVTVETGDGVPRIDWAEKSERDEWLRNDRTANGRWQSSSSNNTSVGTLAPLPKQWNGQLRPSDLRDAVRAPTNEEKHQREGIAMRSDRDGCDRLIKTGRAAEQGRRFP